MLKANSLRSQSRGVARSCEEGNTLTLEIQPIHVKQFYELLSQYFSEFKAAGERGDILR